LMIRESPYFDVVRLMYMDQMGGGVKSGCAMQFHWHA